MSKPADALDPSGVILILLVTVVVPLVIWYLFKVKILIAFYTLSPGAFEWALDHRALLLLTDSQAALFSDLLRDMHARALKKNIPYAGETARQFMTCWGLIVRIPICVLALYFSIKQFANKPSSVVEVGNLSLDRLARLIAIKYPYSLPAINAKLLNKNMFEFTGWRVALQPMEAALHFGLLKYKDKPFPKIPITEIGPLSIAQRRNKIPAAAYLKLDIDRCDRYLASQLGKPWSGVDNLPAPIRALTIAFIAHACGKPLKKPAYKLLGQLSRSFVDHAEADPAFYHKTSDQRFALNLAGVDKLYDQARNHKNFPQIEALMQQHHFESTVIVRLLSNFGGARSKGKLPPNHFLWLRPYHHTLWMALHQLGGQEPWVEGRGVWCHFETERCLGIPLDIPAVQAGTDTLVEVLFAEGWISDAALAAKKQREEKEIADLLAIYNSMTKDGASAAGSQAGRRAVETI